jgi:hypothetical protein
VYTVDPYPFVSGGTYRQWTGNQSRVYPNPWVPSPCGSTLHVYSDTVERKVTLGTIENVGPASYNDTSKKWTVANEDPNGIPLTKNIALRKLAKGNIESIVSIAEGHETISWLTGRLNLLHEFFQLLWKRRYADAMSLMGQKLSLRAEARIETARKGAKGKLDVLSNTWLEWQFAVRPLINDIHGVVDAFQSNIQTGAKIRTTGSATNGDGSIKYKTTVFATVTNPTARTLQQLGLFNISGAMWELIPFSFMFDWLINMGEVLTQGYTVGLGNVCYCTSKETTTYLKGKSTYETIVVYNRYVTLGAPDFTAMLNPSINSGKLMTAIALLHRFAR